MDRAGSEGVQNPRIATRGTLLRCSAAELLRALLEVSAGDSDAVGATSRQAAAIVVRLLSLLNVEAGAIFLLDGDSSMLRLSGGAGFMHSPPRISQAYAIGEGLTGLAYQGSEILWSSDVKRDGRARPRAIAEWEAELPSKSIKTFLSIPFASEGECRGVICLVNRKSPRGLGVDFSRRDRQSAATLSEVLGSVIGLRVRERAADRMIRLFTSLPAEKTLRSAGDLATRTAARIANAAASALYLVDRGDPENLRLAGSSGFRASHQALEVFPIRGSISGRVVTSLKTEMLEEISDTPGVANSAVARAENFRSCLVVPLSAGEERGALVVFSRDRRTFTKAAIVWMQSLASGLAATIDARHKSMDLDSLTTQLAATAHSLRSPLEGISDAFDALRIAVGPESAAQLTISKAFADVERMQRRIKNMLLLRPGVLQIERLNPTRFHLGTLLERCVTRFRGQAEKRRVNLLLFDSARRLHAVTADEDKIDIVFDNLVENAIKYSHANEKIEIRGEESEYLVRITVSDRGLGVKAQERETIFEGFTRSETLDDTRHIPGTGMGLKLVKMIIDAHGGTVSVKSIPYLSDPARLDRMEGFESIFTVTLPRRAGDASRRT